MAKYQRLNFIEREEISRELAAGASLRKVAHAVNRSPSTISREVKQCVANRKYYRAYFAQCRSNIKLRKIHSSRKLDRNYTLRNIVFTFLAKKWSPAQRTNFFQLTRSDFFHSAQQLLPPRSEATIFNSYSLSPNLLYAVSKN